MRTIALILLTALLLIIWGVDLEGLVLLSTGILTVTGVAFFASWSIISNITASLVLIMHSSFKRGSFIRIIDFDNYIEGYISEINLFSTKLITEQREIINYPNNLIISRPSVINPRKRYKTVGKFADFLEQEEQPEAVKPD